MIPPRPTYYECRSCYGLHPAELNCTPEAPLFNTVQLDQKHFVQGWDEIRASEVAAWRAGVAQQRGTTDHE